MVQWLKKDIISHARKHLCDGTGVNETNLKKIISILLNVFKASDIARKEGLLALEEFANDNFNINVDEELFAHDCIILIVDGTDPECIESSMENEMIIDGLDSFEAYLKFIILEGMLRVQEGYNPRIIEFHLLSLIPKELRRKVEHLISDTADDISSLKRKEMAERWDKEIVRKLDNPFLPVFEEKIAGYSNKELSDIINALSIRDIGDVVIFSSQSTKDRVTSLLTEGQKAMLADWIPFYNKDAFISALIRVVQYMQDFDMAQQEKEADELLYGLTLTEDEVEGLFSNEE